MNSAGFNTEDMNSYGGTKNSSKLGGFSSSNYSNLGIFKPNNMNKPKSSYYRINKRDSGSNNTLKSPKILNGKGSSNPSGSNLRSSN